MCGKYRGNYCVYRPDGLVVALECYQLVLILELESRRGEILNNFQKKKKSNAESA